MTISREFHLGLFATAGVPQIVEGDGIELVAADGRRYLDACSGAISVTSLGYGNEAVVEAIAAQLRRLSYTMPFRLTNDRALELAAAMNEVSAGAIDRAMFYTGGSEAVEAALKLARNYHYLNGRTEQGADGDARALVPRQHLRGALRQRRPPAPRAVHPAAGGGPACRHAARREPTRSRRRDGAERLRPRCRRGPPRARRGRRAGAHLGVRHGARGRRRRAGACARAGVLRGRP